MPPKIRDFRPLASLLRGAAAGRCRCSRIRGPAFDLSPSIQHFRSHSFRQGRGVDLLDLPARFGNAPGL
jgi:hypothetical protein